MPAFAEHENGEGNLLDAKSIGLIVDWLRGDWLRPAHNEAAVEKAAEKADADAPPPADPPAHTEAAAPAATPDCEVEPQMGVGSFPRTETFRNAPHPHHNGGVLESAAPAYHLLEPSCPSICSRARTPTWSRPSCATR